MRHSLPRPRVSAPSPSRRRPTAFAPISRPTTTPAKTPQSVPDSPCRGDATELFLGETAKK